MTGLAEDRTWRLLGASARGSSHERTGSPNQDAIGWLPLDGGASLLVVADGHGGPRYIRSSVGSKIAVAVAQTEAAAFVARHLDDEGPELQRAIQHELVPAIVESWALAVRADQADNPLPEGGRDDLEAYGSTIVGALITPSALGFFQIGDGDVVTVTGDGIATRPLPPDPRLVANATTSLCLPTAVDDARTGWLPADADVSIVWVSTDGYSNSFGEDAGFLAVGGDLVDRLLEGGVGGVAGHLSEWLGESARVGGDDTSLVAAVAVDGSGLPLVRPRPAGAARPAATLLAPSLPDRPLPATPPPFEPDVLVGAEPPPLPPPPPAVESPRAAVPPPPAAAAPPPGPPPTAPPPPPGGGPAPSAPPPPPTPIHGASRKALAIIGGGVALLVAAIVLVVVLSSGGSSKETNAAAPTTTSAVETASTTAPAPTVVGTITLYVAKGLILVDPVTGTATLRVADGQVSHDHADGNGWTARINGASLWLEIRHGSLDWRTVVAKPIADIVIDGSRLYAASAGGDEVFVVDPNNGDVIVDTIKVTTAGASAPTSMQPSRPADTSTTRAGEAPTG